MHEGRRNDAVVKVGANAEAAMHGGAMCRSSEQRYSTKAVMQSDAKSMSTKLRQFAQVRCAMFENGCGKDWIGSAEVDGDEMWLLE